MADVVIRRFYWDDRNVAHCADHGVWPDDLDDALDSGEFVVVRNRESGTGSRLFIGRARSGRCIAAPIIETWEPDIWRPISAWPCKPSEAARL